MDPQAAWEQLLEAYAAQDWYEAELLADALVTWLEHGGFPPRATTRTDLGQPWDRVIALAGCQFALREAGKAHA